MAAGLISLVFLLCVVRKANTHDAKEIDFLATRTSITLSFLFCSAWMAPTGPGWFSVMVDLPASWITLQYALRGTISLSETSRKETGKIAFCSHYIIKQEQAAMHGLLSRILTEGVSVRGMYGGFGFAAR